KWTEEGLWVLLFLWTVTNGPLSEASDGKEAGEGHILALVHPKMVRSAVGHRQNGWRKYRRPRPRLSHKGPMPF
uniref:Apelin n=1 Tax=Anolis carolinensis TaxID=28377 RepID=A0A803TLN3_ANOCA